DGDLVIRQHAGPFFAQGQVAKEQGMIDNKDVGVPQLSAGFEIETLLIVRAFPAQAIATVAFHKVPNGGQKVENQVATAAVISLPGPLIDGLELADGIGLGQQEAHPLAGASESAQADVIGPSLDQDGIEFDRHHFLKKRDVLVDELFLEADGMRGDNNVKVFL